MGTEREVPQFPTGVCNGHYYLCVFCEQGEMCFAFVSYFPKAAGFDQRVQFADYDQCDNYIDQSKLIVLHQGVYSFVHVSYPLSLHERTTTKLLYNRHCPYNYPSQRWTVQIMSTQN